MINIPQTAEMDHHLGRKFGEIEGLTQRALHNLYPILGSTWVELGKRLYG